VFQPVLHIFAEPKKRKRTTWIRWFLGAIHNARIRTAGNVVSSHRPFLSSRSSSCMRGGKPSSTTGPFAWSTTMRVVGTCNQIGHWGHIQKVGYVAPALWAMWWWWPIPDGLNDCNLAAAGRELLLLLLWLMELLLIVVVVLLLLTVWVGGLLFLLLLLLVLTAPFVSWLLNYNKKKKNKLE